MKVFRLAVTMLALALSVPTWAQMAGSDVVVDYNNPKKYIVGGVVVDGNSYYSSEQILQVAGLHKGLEITVPSEELSSVVTRLWAQRYFEDVSISVDSIAPSRDTAFFKISLIERPRVSRWVFSGVKSGEEKELRERLNFRRGTEFSEYISKTSVDIIKRY